MDKLTTATPIAKRKVGQRLGQTILYQRQKFCRMDAWQNLRMPCLYFIYIGEVLEMNQKLKLCHLAESFFSMQRT